MAILPILKTNWAAKSPADPVGMAAFFIEYEHEKCLCRRREKFFSSSMKQGLNSISINMLRPETKVETA